MMAHKTIYICDRCGAQFDMSEERWEKMPMGKRRPLYSCDTKIDLGVGNGAVEIHKSCCEPCRDKFKELVRGFFS